MNLLMLTPDLPPAQYGGVGTHAYELCENLVTTIPDVNITVIVVRCDGPIEQNPNLYNIRDKIKVIYYNLLDQNVIMHENKELESFTYRWTKNNIDVMQTILQYIDLESYDIIHIHDFFLAWIFDLIKSKTNVPTICTIHACSALTMRIEETLRRHIRYNCDRVIAVSKHLKNQLNERYGGNPEINVIYNGVKLGETCNWEDKKNIITYCGRLMSTKGADVLIEAFSKLMKDKDYCSYPLALHIIGDGDLKTNLMNLCKENGIEKFVVFHGNIPNEQARKIIRKAKIHVVPSTYEPYGLTAIEALAEGTCVIASKVGGLIEFLSDGDNALLVPPADPNILADKIKYLINDKEGNQLAMKLAKNGYQYASTQTWENIALKTYEIYQYLIKKRVNNLD